MQDSGLLLHGLGVGYDLDEHPLNEFGLANLPFDAHGMRLGVRHRDQRPEASEDPNGRPRSAETQAEIELTQELAQSPP